MSTTAEDLRSIALAEFSAAGYAATSLQRIADLAGLSKSSVLYHYGSKEALLQAAVRPAVSRLAGILDTVEVGDRMVAGSATRRQQFIAELVDFLLAHRLEMRLLINQGTSLDDIPVVDRANALVRRLAGYVSSTLSLTEHRMRFGVALEGAANILASNLPLGLDTDAEDEVRAALIVIVTELLAPLVESGGLSKASRE